MMVWAIKDYFGSFRWGRIKETYKAGGWWIYLYFLTVLPLVWQMYETEGQMLAYFLINIPILFCLFAATLHPIALPKILYLCPMSLESRRKYIVAVTSMHIAVPIFLGVCGAVVLLAWGICDWLMVLGVIINIVGLSFIMSTSAGRKLAESANEKNGRQTSESWALEFAGLIAAMIFGIFFVGMMEWGTSKYSMIAKGLAVAGSAIINGAVLVKFGRNWSYKLEKAMHFEYSHGISESNIKSK